MELLHAHHGHVPAFGKGQMEIAPGETLVIEGHQVHEDIYVDGTGDRKAILRLTDGCRLDVKTILLNGPNARIESDGEIACEVVWRDLPLDLVNDPEQFGNGLVCLSGEAVWTGKEPRQSTARVWKELHAGEAVIALESEPAGWQVGDELWIPDTRQPMTSEELIERQPEVVKIVGIQGSIIDIDRPLAIDHLGWRDSSGQLQRLFHIANATQSIVFRSENPNGTRGHSIFMDHCHIDISGFSFREMGRTTTDPLHSTKWDPHTGAIQQLGTNQIGRYAGPHLHGMPGREDSYALLNDNQFRIEHFSVVGSPKFGPTLHHSTHFGYIGNFAVLDCAGGHIVTETPNVYANYIQDGIIIAKRAGSGNRITSRDDRNKPGGDHWHNRVGLALASAMNVTEDIAIYGCTEAIGMAGFATSTLYRPTKRGVHTEHQDREIIVPKHKDKEREYPFLVSRYVEGWANWRGIETWTANCHEDTPKMFPGLTLVHSRHPTDFEDQRETTLFDWHILGDHSKVRDDVPPASHTFGLDFKPGYRFGVKMIGGEISGYESAYDAVLDDEYTIFDGVHIDCPLAAYHSLGRYSKLPIPARMEWLNCTWGPTHKKPMDGWYPKYDLKLWMRPGRRDRMSLQPITYLVSPWRDGRNYRLFHYEQHPGFALAPIADDKAYGDWPNSVSTNAELIARGTPIFGEAIPEEAQLLEEFSPFWALDVTPAPLTLEQRIERLEQAVFGPSP